MSSVHGISSRVRQTLSRVNQIIQIVFPEPTVLKVACDCDGRSARAEPDLILGAATRYYDQGPDITTASLVLTSPPSPHHLHTVLFFP